MSKTLQVLADRRGEVDDLVAAGEVLDLRFHGKNTAMSLRAAKLLHFLVAAAGGEAGKDMVHTLALNDINDVAHRSKEELLEAARELAGTTVRLEITTAKGRKASKVGPLLADLERDEEWDGELRYQISPILREVMRRSNHWAILSRQAVNAFQSRYSLRLYELISLRVGLDHVQSETFTIDELRRLFGVPPKKLTTWSNLRMKTLDASITEVSQLTGLRVRYTPIKRGRRVAAVKLEWQQKDHHERSAAAAELDRPKVGRQARRDGTVEQVRAPAQRLSFPTSGSIKYAAGPWVDVPNPSGKDRDLIAQDFRAWCASKGIALDAPNIVKIWTGFMAKVKL